ncbi:uncharacterized membrane protein YkvA (DUF1232 family) [Methylohalomonas lacus]|uniref:Uncharacterized membrane protein YkvA (DUF1232 family) n=1 Tax=Methylohalomonas lacus TaxID=398773 RepID=A0AAE3L1S7_9GAMM|nr:DUF1232 domain-containing protein [Methylohalomonas lacus]MCS3904030.1 uncharacterized membrane protein YkvA (DUF1232 family) [Methylohalomonas lacus]
MPHWRQLVTRIKAESSVWRCVAEHPGTPRSARWLLGLALFYLLSPVDLIPDWIPLLGQLDDLVIVPLLIWLARRRIPAWVIDDCRARQHQSVAG